MPLTQEAYEWWDGAAWVAAETYVAHVDQDSFTFAGAEWGDRTDTYELSISVEDENGGKSSYSNVVTLNPYEWWDGAAWVGVETSIAHVDQDSIDIPANTFVAEGVYYWTVEVWDEADANSGYAAEKWFMVASPVQTLSPSGIPSGETFGNLSVTQSATVEPAGIASAEAFGDPNVAQDVVLEPVSIDSEEAFGLPELQLLITISPDGIPSEEVFGAVVLEMGPVVLVVTGIASAEAFGIPLVQPPGVPWIFVQASDQSLILVDLYDIELVSNTGWIEVLGTDEHIEHEEN